MGTAIRLNAGARLYRDVMIASYSNIFSGTTWARISPDSHATCAIADFIQGSTSQVGQSIGGAVFGSWNHSLDAAVGEAGTDNVDPYHSFVWFGLVDGFLVVEVFDGRALAGLPTRIGSGTHLTVTSSARVPTTPVCCHVACVANWASSAVATGTYTLYVDGVAVGSGTTNPTTSAGLSQFFLDFPSLTIGTSKDGYRPQVGAVRLMNLRGASFAYSAAQLLAEANSPCSVLLVGDKFNYPFNAVTGIHHDPAGSGTNLTLETGSTTIDLTVPDCCGDGGGPGPGPDPEPEPPGGGGTPAEPPFVAPSYHLDARYIRRLRRAPHLAQENSRVFYRRFELDLERGVGLADGQGSDPMVLLRISRDGGQTWGEEQRMSAGRLGEYTARVIARRLGQARDTVFEVVVSDPVAWSLVGAWLDLEAGTS